MGLTVQFYFYGRLQELARNRAENCYCFSGAPAVKDAIEAQGIPHTEVELILVAGDPVGFEKRLQGGESCHVYSFDAVPQLDRPFALRSPPAEPHRFILDVHLGKLARRLRMLGFDCRYRNDYSDPQIIRLGLAEERIILTRDRGILKHACVEHGYLVGSHQVEAQLLEVVQRYRLQAELQLLRRCPLCNGKLAVVEKQQILTRLKPKTQRYYDEFFRCSDCDQLYWQGAHYANISRWLSELSQQL